MNIKYKRDDYPTKTLNTKVSIRDVWSKSCRMKDTWRLNMDFECSVLRLTGFYLKWIIALICIWISFSLTSSSVGLHFIYREGLVDGGKVWISPLSWWLNDHFAYFPICISSSVCQSHAGLTLPKIEFFGYALVDAPFKSLNFKEYCTWFALTLGWVICLILTFDT